MTATTAVKCEVCGKGFKSQRSLITHQQFHCKGDRREDARAPVDKCEHDLRLIPSGSRNILMQRARQAGFTKYCVHCGGLE